MAQLLPNTPQVNLEGLFKVKAPYTLPDKVIYRVDAVQNFRNSNVIILTFITSIINLSA